MGAPGKRLWKQVTSVYALEPFEETLLVHACRLQDRLADLESYLRDTGLTVLGSMQQERLNPAVIESRQTRVALCKVLGQIGFPNEDGKPMTSRSRHGQIASVARWHPKAPASGGP
jgi:hypothetical protein